MDYIEIKFDLNYQDRNLNDILVAILSDIGFEGFFEENGFLMAYIPEPNFDLNSLSEVIEPYSLEFEKNIIKQKNWNEEWEKNFDPIVIDDILAILAPFHSQTFNTKYKIFIEPKMSFGTGHHATTYMLCKMMPSYDFNNKKVLDFGCGTGILAIYASHLGASEIVAIDVDEWAYENTLENVQRNFINNISVYHGDINKVPSNKYDIILANINLNVLKKDIPVLSLLMKKNSLIFLSGFLSNELNQIVEVCKNCGLDFVNGMEKDLWYAGILKKIY